MAHNLDEYLNSLPPVGVAEVLPVDQASFGTCTVFDGTIQVSRDRALLKKTIQFDGLFAGETSPVFIEVNRKLRDTIYGAMYHGIKLDRANADGNVFVRTEKTFAIKTYLTSKMKEHASASKHGENPIQEFGSLQLINEAGGHTNICQLLALGHDPEHIFSFFEFIDGPELLDLISSQGAFDEDVARFVFRQIINGLKFLHAHGLGHRDLSCENLMMCSNGICKIIDLGASIKCQTVDVEDIGRIVMPLPKKPIFGKKIYIAPEVFRQTEIFSPLLIDIWDLGVILFIMLAGVPPWQLPSPSDSRYNLVVGTPGGVGSLLAHWEKLCSEAAIDLITRLLREHPGERLSLDEILAHPWMLEPDTTAYPDASEHLASLSVSPDVIHRPFDV